MSVVVSGFGGERPGCYVGGNWEEVGIWPRVLLVCSSGASLVLALLLSRVNLIHMATVQLHRPGRRAPRRLNLLPKHPSRRAALRAGFPLLRAPESFTASL